jgi:hypothetical protein
LRMQTLEVFKVPVKERVLVVPFDLQGERSVSGMPHVIHLVRLGLAFVAIDDGLHKEFVLPPADAIERIAQALGRLGLAAAALDQFTRGQPEAQKNRDQRLDLVTEIPGEDRPGMIARVDIEA